MVALFVLTGYVFDYSYITLGAFATNVALYLTVLQQGLSLFLHWQRAGRNNPWLNVGALHHILFQTGFIFNVIVTLVYWTLLHPFIGDLFLGNPLGNL